MQQYICRLHLAVLGLLGKVVKGWQMGVTICHIIYIGMLFEVEWGSDLPPRLFYV